MHPFAKTEKSMRQRMVAGNWKMHGNLVSNKALLDEIVAGMAGVQGVHCAVCVPFPYIFQAQFALQNTEIVWGGQNCSQHEKGAYTGEVAPAMLRDLGCSVVTVGHSERRALYGEDDATVADKFIAAQQAGLIPILCVGETLDEREKGITGDVVERQLQAVLSKVGLEGFARCVIAYEPVWAIGTGKTATPQQAQEVHAFIRALFAEHSKDLSENMIILYGGSVKGANAKELFAMPDIDGGLIGGASLDANEFIAICKAAQR
jgi:triosephosphate isomerase (TIM)